MGIEVKGKIKHHISANALPNKSLDVRAKQLLFKILGLSSYCSRLAVTLPFIFYVDCSRLNRGDSLLLGNIVYETTWRDNEMIQIICLLCMVTQLVCITAGCGRRSELLSLNSSVATSDAPSTIPFDVIDNRIFVDVKLNGKGPFRFIFDSGAGAIITPELAKELGLKIEGTSQSGGAGEKTVDTGNTKVTEMQVGNVRLTDQPFGVISFADAKYVFGTARVDGVIGDEVLQRFVVKIDYERNRLSFMQSSQFVYRGSGTILPIQRPRLIPIVEGEVDGIACKFGIDTGARSSLILYGPFVEENNLVAKYQPKVEGITGWGIGGPIRSQVARINLLKLGAVEVRSVVTRFSLQKSGALTSSAMAGLVGPDVLKQFNVTFDYSRERMILEKNKNYGTPDTFDRAGMWLGQDGKIFEVIDVMKDSPAAEAGIKAGDRILAIDGKSAERLDLLVTRLKFKNDPPNEKVRLTLLSGNEQREITIVLRNLV